MAAQSQPQEMTTTSQASEMYSFMSSYMISALVVAVADAVAVTEWIILVTVTAVLVILMTAVLAVAAADTVADAESVILMVVVVDAEALVVISIVGNIYLGKMKNHCKKGSTSNRRFLVNIRP